jgi:cystathionine beta-lyase
MRTCPVKPEPLKPPQTSANKTGRKPAMPDFEALTVPVHRATTVVYRSAHEFLNRSQRLLEGFSYGLYGNPTVKTLEWRVSEVEGGTHTMLVPSGLAAITLPLLACLRCGDHVLIADCVYGPTKEFCKGVLSRFGITHSIFPSDAGSIEPWLNDQTRLVLLESPGSYSMEIQDISVIAAQARGHGALVMMDNTWGFGRTNLFEHGIDIVSTALSKYASGHSDVCLGACTVSGPELFDRLRTSMILLGIGVSADDAYLVLRGLQTLDVRLNHHARHGYDVAKWLTTHPAVDTVFYPALETDSQHARYKRFFSGSNGVISLVLKERDPARIECFVDALRVFRIGASWGGTQSLIALTNMADARTAGRWPQGPWVIRLHIGLEPLATLIEDLENAFDLLP